MKDIQKVFEQIQQIKKEQKTLKAVYKDSLNSDPEYKRISDELAAIKAKKKKIEENAKASMGADHEKLERLTIDLKAAKELLNDIAVSSLMSGKSIELKDEQENIYEPIYTVSFKKTRSGPAAGAEDILLDKNTWED